MENRRERGFPQRPHAASVNALYTRNFGQSLSKIILRDSFKRDPRLRDQLGSSSESVASLISEGFEQSTDRHFAQYCYRSRGSSRETRTQLVVAVQRNHMTETERLPISNDYEEIAKMLTGLIEHLETENRKHRR